MPLEQAKAAAGRYISYISTELSLPPDFAKLFDILALFRYPASMRHRLSFPIGFPLKLFSVRQPASCSTSQSNGP